LSPAQRSEHLAAQFHLGSATPGEHLKQLIAGGNGLYGEWIRACAIYAAVGVNQTSLVPLMEAALESQNSALRQTAAWALHQLAPQRFQEHAPALAADGAPPVAELVRALAPGAA